MTVMQSTSAANIAINGVFMNWGKVVWKRRNVNGVSVFAWTQSVGCFFPSPSEASINKSSSISGIQMSTSVSLPKSKG